MTQHYLGVKIIEAWPAEKDGEPGYGVKYDNGYQSWSPKDVFERAYIPMGAKRGTEEPREAPHRDTFFPNSDSVTEKMVDDFIFDIQASQEDDRTTKVVMTLANGWVLRDFSACVSAANFDMTIGRDICVKRMRSKVWEYLGFVLACGLHGVDGRFPEKQAKLCCGENEGCDSDGCTGYSTRMTRSEFEAYVEKLWEAHGGVPTYPLGGIDGQIEKLREQGKLTHVVKFFYFRPKEDDGLCLAMTSVTAERNAAGEYEFLV